MELPLPKDQSAKKKPQKKTTEIDKSSSIQINKIWYVWAPWVV